MITELQEIGLTKNEAKVYSALLELGSTTAGKLIKKANLHRNIVYDNLEKLTKKGLVSYVIMKGIKHFEATQAGELRAYIEKQKKEILARERKVDVLLPLIEQKRKEILRPAEAAIYKGKKGLKTVLEQVLSPKYELLIFATGWGMKQTMGSYYYQWHNKLKEKRVKGRAVLSRKMKQKEAFPYKIRYVSEKFMLPSTIIVYGNKVINVIWQEEPLTIVIESEEAAQSYKTYFELLWNLAKP